MEEELKCAVCHKFYVEPVLLPCSHALCFNCAVTEQKPASEYENVTVSSADSIESDNDKHSVTSETDSGVVCSRSGSFVFSGIGYSPSGSKYALSCPVCRNIMFLDENGSLNLAKYKAMQRIVDAMTGAASSKCDLCASEPPASATVYCRQCEVLYCDGCRDRCHPARGPLVKHTLVEANASRAADRCVEHDDERPLFCAVCKMAVCTECLRRDHMGHDVQPVSAMCKEQKLELSQYLQRLSSKARSTTDNLSKLKNIFDDIDENYKQLENRISEQCDLLIRMINDRKSVLLEQARKQKDSKRKSLNEQIFESGAKLHQATGFFQFCFEVLKEPDPIAFLQAGSIIINRLNHLDMCWYKEIDSKPKVSPNFELNIDDKCVARTIQQMNFIQMKVPGIPVIIPDECSAENNNVIVAWQAPEASFVEGYLLELDDGSGGEFREVYCGKETICTVDGLHFNCIYKARVKAFNSSGEGGYSDVIGLQTADVAWFAFEPYLSSNEMRFSCDRSTVSCEGFEHRVALGSVGFSKGVHYWRFTVDRYDADTDPCFGVALADVCTNTMLGKDDKGWSMYVDKKRSWFMHNNVHQNRLEGGISVGSTVGVLLNLVKHELSFYINDEPQGLVAFQNMYGVFYPAVSVNRGVTVTLHSSLEPPVDIEQV